MISKTPSILLIAFCIVATGCIGGTTGDDINSACSPGETAIEFDEEPANAIGGVNGFHISESEVPENATVIPYDDVKDHPLLRLIIHESIREGETLVKMNRSTMDEYRNAVSELPEYEGDERGYYVNCDGKRVYFFDWMYA